MFDPDNAEKANAIHPHGTVAPQDTNSPPTDEELAADGSPARFRRPDEAAVFEGYAAIIRRLRGDGGCPWDRKQTLRSLRRFIIEESFEVLAALEDATRPFGDGPPEDRARPAESAGYHAVAEELGDVILVVMLLADALERESTISFREILLENGRKLIRRHPHVFGDVEVASAEHVIANWNEIKTTQEGRSSSALAVSAGLPPLEYAYETQKKAAKVGFDWPEIDPVIDKLKEEIAELEVAIAEAKDRQRPLKNSPEIEDEIGDILFSAVNLSRHLDADPSVALAATNRKFLSRISYVERKLAEKGTSMKDSTLSEMDQLWNEAKQESRPR
jgi:tetrapyrrole methylase family protein / MazG family protein